MDPLTGALLAVGVAWASILLVVHAPLRIDPRRLRFIGAVAIALLGLQVLGAPLPAWAPLAWTTGGVLGVSIWPRGAAAA